MAQAVSTRPARGGIWSAVAVLVVTLPTGYLAARASVPITHNRYFPWIVGRTLGIASYLALAALVSLGIWLRHPWRHRWPLAHPEARLRMHAGLGVATCILVGGHIAALASDPYAGVGWPKTLVPGASGYRPTAVTLGVVGFYFLIAITATAALGGRLIGTHWLLVHRLATPTLLLTWFHGVLAGTDTARLRFVYAITGVSVALLWLSRILARPARMAEVRSGPAPAGRGRLVAPMRELGR